MQLKSLIATAAIATTVALMALPASAQSLSPMRKVGATPSDIKAFKLQVGNPYDQRMTFTVVPMDPKFEHPVESARVLPNEVRLAPGAARGVTLQFKIDQGTKERTIAVCVMPKELAGPVLPRVCGTYTGRIVSAGASG